MAPPGQIPTHHDAEFHHTVLNISTTPIGSPESQPSGSSELSIPSQSTPVTASTVPPESLDSSISTSPSTARPSKRAKTTQVSHVSDSNTPSTAGIAQPELQVAARPTPRLVIRLPRRSRSPPARTVYLQGGYLQPGDSQYEVARLATGERIPYWFRGDVMLGYRDPAHEMGGVEGVRAVERVEVVEIRLDEEEESEKKKGKRKAEIE
ncbi:hypothetical protein EKO04_005871 [Ascochyta lentis]|uniref:Uncharacterized protein n=1 Tax=Ascochyta lentis TaxID=205686 RepID=A0A8H7J373_9PLEO|nr:hypothetical protein EKO04_005871 [Ascochyta lentis]